MSSLKLASLVVLSALSAQISQGAPILSVTPLGPNELGDSEWVVTVAPDASLFGPGFPMDVLGGSMAVELAFRTEGGGGFLDFDVNTAAWDLETVAMNPFTGTMTEGLWLNPLTDPVRDAFGAFGSVFFTSDDPVVLFTITTGGSDLMTKIHYGEAASGSSTLGARIAQGGQNFDGYTGWAMNVPEPTSAALALMAAISLGVRCRRASQR